MDINSVLAGGKSSETLTPSYVFDVDVFHDTISNVKGMLKDIPLTFSIKANPFLVSYISDELEYVEVCSPGELEICISNNISPDRIIYSGVNKDFADVDRAINYGVKIVTAESLRHLEIEQSIAKKCNKKQKCILRLTSGNQFGMSKECLMDVLSSTDKYPNIEFFGIHYYSGTQKKLRQLNNDIENLMAVLDELKKTCSFEPQLVEYGPGLSVDYFNSNANLADISAVDEISQLINGFASKYPLGIEMGRFLAAECGTFVTKVADVKENNGVNYLICDGGIHQIKYYGQTMAMQVPPIEYVGNAATPKKHYCLCGSLCTVADVIVRDVELPEIKIGDTLAFLKCGAYSMTEGSLMFLSRNLPVIYVYSKEFGIKQIRNNTATSDFNMAKADLI